MDEATRQLVRQRARHRCEYCGIEQRHYPDYTFHVEHVVAKQHHGNDKNTNLALACHLCNRKKGPNLAGVDPDSGLIAPIFHPRKEEWNEHFHLEENGWITGLTPIGRATVDVLGMNTEARRQIRQAILALGPAESLSSGQTDSRSSRTDPL